MNTFYTLRTIVLLAVAAISTSSHAVDTKSRTTNYEYNAQGQLAKEVREPSVLSECLVTDYVYDTFGNRTSVSSKVCAGASGSTVASAATPRANSSSFSADGRFATGLTNALGQSETRGFDGRFGVINSLTGPNGLTTVWQFDEFGRKTQELRADGTKTVWSYLRCSDTGANCPASLGSHVVMWVMIENSYAVNQSINAPEKRQFYDQLGRLLRIQTEGFDTTGVVTPLWWQDTQYDAHGRVSRQSEWYSSTDTPVWRNYTYDVLGRMLSESHPEKIGSTPTVATSTTTYAGLTTVTRNANNQTKTTVKNALGQIQSVTDSLGSTITYQYDALGNLTQTNAAGSITAMQYDLRGNKVGMQDPAMGSWTYAYNAYGELVSQRDSLSQSTALEYDSLGRLVKRVEPDLVSQWSYDLKFDATPCGKGIGKLCEAKSDNGYKRVHSYDNLGRSDTIATVLDNAAAPAVVRESFDSNTGRVNQKTWPTGYQASYAYTSLGYLKSVSGGGSAGGSVPAAVSYACANGFTLSGSNCTKAASPNYACSAGYALSGNTCTKQVVSAATPNYYCPQYWTIATYASQTVCANSYSFDHRSMSWNGPYPVPAGMSYVGKVLSNSSGYGTDTYYYTRLIGSYSCASGTLSGTSCTTTLTQTASVASYSCGSGESSQGSICLKAASPIYSCYVGTVSGSTCVTGADNSAPSVSYTVTKMNAAGQITEYQNGNAITTVKEYDLQTQRLKSIRATTLGQTDGNVLNHSYSFDALGNLLTREDTSPGVGTSETFAYDTLNRLTIATILGGGVSPPTSTQVMYDTRGNIMYKSDVGRYWYDGARPNLMTQVTLETAPGATVALTGTRRLSYAYDNYRPSAQTVNAVTLGNGNLEYTVSQDVSTGRHSVRYEKYTSFNMPVQVTLGSFTSNTPTVSYSCDAGYTLSGTTCVSAAPAKPLFTCPVGSILTSNNTCLSSAPTPKPTVHNTCGAPTEVPWGGKIVYSEQHYIENGVSDSGSVYLLAVDGYCNFRATTYENWPKSTVAGSAIVNSYTNPNYSCSEDIFGWQTCGYGIPSHEIRVRLPMYSCPDLTKLVGLECKHVEQAPIQSGLKCPPNSTISGTSCVTTAKPEYSCLSGQILSGSVCLADTSGTGSGVPNLADRTLSFLYGSEHQRIKQNVTLSGNGTSAYFSGNTWYLNGEDSLGLTYEKEVRTNGTTEHKHYVSAGGLVFALVITRSGTLNGLPASSTNYFYKDHLGSVAAIANEAGVVIERLAYDPWGKRRFINTTPGLTDKLDAIVGVKTDRGYTEHEHLDEVGVIHMNGRIYDPLIGRFMSADPTVQAPYNLKSFNRYSYVWNNPLAMFDPTGFFSWSVGGPNDTGSTSYSYTNSDGSSVNYGGTGLFNSYGESSPNLKPVGSNRDVTVAGQAISGPSPVGTTWNGVSTYRSPAYQFGENQTVVSYIAIQNSPFSPVASRSDAIEKINFESFAIGGFAAYKAMKLAYTVGVIGFAEFMSMLDSVANGEPAGASGGKAAKGVANPVSETLARVVPGNLNPKTLGSPSAADVFVTNASELRGLSAKQIAEKLSIPESSSFRVIEFPSANVQGIASPIGRTNPGFIPGGRTAGGASEFVIPNGPIPRGAVDRIVP